MVGVVITTCAVAIATPTVADAQGCGGSTGSAGTGSGTGSAGSGSAGSGSAGSGSAGSGSAGSGSAGSGAGAVNPIPWLNGRDGHLPNLQGRTQAISHLTGPLSPNDTVRRFGVLGTDLGIMWDNGKGQVLTAFGDTFGLTINPFCGFVGDWRSNVLLRSGDRNLSDGMGFDSAALDRPNHAKEIIPSQKIAGVEITVIPTSGIAVGDTQYINFMSVRSWGAPGHWVTNFAGVAYSTDNGENWTVDPTTLRPNLPGGFDNFQMASYLQHGDGWLYQFGTPPGRSGDARLARVRPEAVRNTAAYEYWNGTGWTPTNPGAAASVIPGPVSELSVQWNDHLGAFVSMYTDGSNSIVMRKAPNPWGPWGAPDVLVSSRDVPELYGAYIHPWSSGSDLYFLATTWSDYNVMLMRTTL
ncbi:DUF4185 domain-containing protein [Antrihabitans cavernicola]|uniref:DUF4185 domain-containing protein n=2 Tax=Antrihabitans cavernicola TaxID=2495913 RepID=A0A5A7SK65_9NOCA|nr:DUF4185 domain-containing protein [Spelaeibacter cavernicola]